MTDVFIDIILTVAAIVAAFFIGANQEKKKARIKQLEKQDADNKLAEAIEAANNAVPDNDLRKWLRDNAKK